MKKTVFVIIAVLFINATFACTTFLIKDKNGNPVFGRNFDFPVGMGHIEINYRGMNKTAFIRPPEKPLSWVSEYGSISFNQIGREFPYGGMNEAGLVIEQMWLQEARYPETDNRYGLSELNWIQYQLDNAATVQDVIDSDALVRISGTSVATLHFLVADAGGDVATIEFLDGIMIVHRGAGLPYPVLANCTYQTSVNYKESKDKMENRQFNPWTENSSGRFAKAAGMIEKYDGNEDIIDYSFRILDSVAQNPGTQWSIAYDIKKREIHYKSTQNNSVQKVSLNDFDLSCQKERFYIDLAETNKGKESFRELSFEANLELLDKVVEGVDFLRENIPPEANRAMTEYALSIVCNENNPPE